MEEKIQLAHPMGKKAVKINVDKYTHLRQEIEQALNKGPLTHKEMLYVIRAQFDHKNIKFEGSLEWFLEWVKLDLEARRLIERLKDKNQLKFRWAMEKKNEEFSFLPSPAQRALYNHDIFSLEDLAGFSEIEMLQLHGLGKSSLPMLKAVLKKEGLTFKM